MTSEMNEKRRKTGISWFLSVVCLTTTVALTRIGSLLADTGSNA